jgi:uncharacterized repeat protein (TIGR01451 family)
VRKQNRTSSLKFGGAVLVTLFLLVTWFAQPAMGVTPPMQEDRPTLPPPQPGPSGGGAEGEEGMPAGTCAGLRGTVINWGFQNEPGITLRLGDGGWETTQVTSTDGSYQFGPLGEGVAFLSVDLPSKQAEVLRPMADDVAIRLRCDFDMIANLGLYSSPSRPDPPATLTMGVSRTGLMPGGTVTFYLPIENGMPHSISHVFVTDFLPDGLTVADVTTTRGTVEVLDGRMVTVNIGDLPQGAKETIQIVAQVDATLAYGTRLKNVASLLYAESAADQAWATLTVGSTAEVAAATPTPLTSPSPAQPSTPTPATTAEETPPPALPTPVADQTPVPDDELLPVTGGELTAVLPMAGFVLALLLLGVRHLRERSVVE